VPPGHFYSPVPTEKEIEAQQDRIFRCPDQLEGLDLNEEAQLTLLKTLAPLINDVSFNAEPQPDRRYFANNDFYNQGDAAILQAFLRHLRPQRYLEVGSGWTTALARDTNDRWLDSRLRITCIEPKPDHLNRLLRPGDDVEVIVSPVQDVDLARFKELESGDILFIDCSHVVKTGSDAKRMSPDSSSLKRARSTSCTGLTMISTSSPGRTSRLRSSGYGSMQVRRRRPSR
jgi:hypothetical protein